MHSHSMIDNVIPSDLFLDDRVRLSVFAGTRIFTSNSSSTGSQNLRNHVMYSRSWLVKSLKRDHLG